VFYYSGELHDFLEDNLKSWYPELAGKFKIMVIKALPSVLPIFSKQLITYTELTFKESKVNILMKTMVKEVKKHSVILQMPDKSIKEVPCSLVVWAAGNKGHKITQDLMAKLPTKQTSQHGITVNGSLRMKGAKDVFAIGDCTATSQQGTYLTLDTWYHISHGNILEI
jgi:NADH:ubiquinone reductase (non-electrogenic)